MSQKRTSWIEKCYSGIQNWIHQKENYRTIIGLQNTNEIAFSNTYGFLMPISKALLCFMLVFGGIGGYVSCFTTEFDVAMVALILLVLSFVIAFVKNFSSGFLRNICYLAFFFLFAFSIFRYYVYVNSGYHAVTNLTYAALENYLQIPALIYYEEIIEDSFITITYFLVYLGIFELLLFHMWISEYVNLWTIFLVSFGPYVAPFFMNLYPEKIYVIFLLASYIAFFFISLSCHTKAPKKKENSVVYFKHYPMQSRSKGFCYGVNGLTYLATTIISLILAFCIWGILQISFPYSTYRNYQRDSVLKENVTDDVKYMVTFGLSGYFNRYNSKGGTSEGKLGGVYSVRPDYEPDLNITFVPTSYDTIYLRGFVGVGYVDRQWLSLRDLYLDNHMIDDKQAEVLAEDQMLGNEFNQLDNANLSSGSFRMDIKNLDANIRYNYNPYYTNPDNLYPIYAQNVWMRNNIYWYYPDNYSYRNINSTPLSQEQIKTLEYYLQVPSDTRNNIIKFMSDNNLLVDYIAESTAFAGYSGAELQSIINKISYTLSNDFTYSLNPGITPKNADFVGYFLNNNKKGFCVHFATSAALMLRTLGIPTRYVEGYILTSEELEKGTVVEDAYPSVYYNSTATPENFAVVNVNIADDKAHAWLEYYDPDFGWRIFEATTASVENLGTSNFWTSLYGLLSTTTESNIDTETEIQNIEKISDNIWSMGLRFLLVVGIIFTLFILLFLSYKITLQYRSYHRNRRNINLRNYYKIICKNVSRHYPEFAYILSMKEQLIFIQTHYKTSKKFTEASINKLSPVLERAAFSKIEISLNEYNYAFTMLKILRRNITFHF